MEANSQRVYFGKLFADKVTAAVGPGANIGERNKMAKKMFEEASQELKDQLEREVEENREDTSAKFFEDMKGQASTDPATQEQ